MSLPDSRAAAGLHRTIPALPVRRVDAAVAYYRDRFGFEAVHEAGDFAVLVRDDAVLHLWGATDEDWRSREGLDRNPIRSGAESFLAGTASCRIEVTDVDALYAELQAAGVLHDVSRGGVTATDFGSREFATLDDDGNLLTFFRWNTTAS
jgi:catechol 2,3-dioxygenase-like lactoylglutathione lyase family enzyme